MDKEQRFLQARCSSYHLSTQSVQAIHRNSESIKIYRTLQTTQDKLWT